MGYAYNSFCHPTVVDASLQACANAYPVVAIEGGAVVVASCSGVDASGALTVVKSVDGSASASIAVPAYFASCEWETFPNSPANLSIVDGALVAGAVASVWFIAWGTKALRYAIQDNSNESV